jgi:putative hydrolase of the HAD superfamily
MPRRDVDFVLFDLGGVLIELGGITMLQELAGIASDEEVWTRWLGCPWVRKFEKGKCSATEFSVGVVSEWQLDISPERFLEVFRDWPIGPYPGARILLEEVQRSVPIGCLSNTNSLHWEHQSVAWPMLGMFDATFLSFELGLVKPDADIFQAVADELPVHRQRVLYLDDVALNADAARNFGFRSEQVRGPDECRTALKKFGLPAR